MNWQKLQENIGWRMRLTPPVIYLDEHGDQIYGRDENWVISGVVDECLLINNESGGYVYRLAKDHIKNFTSEPEKDRGYYRYGILTLLVQFYIQGYRMWLVPTPQPGVAVPHTIDKAQRARDHFTPELAQTLRSVVYGADRSITNFSELAAGRRHIQGDTWKSLLPNSPSLYPVSPAFDDLSNQDARLLAEFYGAVTEVIYTLGSWIGQQSLNDQNAWNFIAHRFEHALHTGHEVVAKFCPDRPFDPTMPAAGKLIDRIERSLVIANRTRSASLARHTQRQ